MTNGDDFAKGLEKPWTFTKPKKKSWIIFLSSDLPGPLHMLLKVLRIGGPTTPHCTYVLYSLLIELLKEGALSVRPQSPGMNCNS